MAKRNIWKMNYEELKFHTAKKGLGTSQAVDFVENVKNWIMLFNEFQEIS